MTVDGCLKQIMYIAGTRIKFSTELDIRVFLNPLPLFMITTTQGNGHSVIMQYDIYCRFLVHPYPSRM